MVSFLINQMISGPMKQPRPQSPPVTRPPSRIDRCANSAHWRSSWLGVAVEPIGSGGGTGSPEGGGGGTTESGGTLMPGSFDDAGLSPVMAMLAKPGDRAIVQWLLPAHGHPVEQDGAGQDLRPPVHVVAHRHDAREH